MKANKIRGDVEISLDDKKYILRPTMETLLQIEEELGSLISVYNSFSNRAFKIKEMATIISLSIIGDDVPTKKEILDIIFEKGISEFIPPVIVFIANAIGGSDNFIVVDKDKTEGEDLKNVEAINP